MNVTERTGVSRIQLIVNEEFNWIFREQSVEDYGIDAHIEIQDKNYAQGKIIAVQIKSGESYFRNNSENKIAYYAELKHIRYWENNILPVIIVLYNPTTKECIWHHVEGIDETKILIDRSSIFDSSAKFQLEKIANMSPYESVKNHRRIFIEKQQDLELLKEQIINDEKNKNLSLEKTVAIDFGTTQTRLVFVEEKGISYVESSKNKKYFDSIIGFNDDYQYYVGEEALERMNSESFVAVRAFKRELGRGKRYKIFNLELSAEDITTLFLWKIISIAEKKYNIKFEKCWLAKPVDFSYWQMKSYEKCIIKCGLQIKRVLSESSCVVINPTIVNKKGLQGYIIIDLGGGTFDSSIVEMGTGVIEVLGTVGDQTLGGIDYDYLLRDYIEDKIGEIYPDVCIDEKLTGQLICKAEETKIWLSQQEDAEIIISGCYDSNKGEEIFCKIRISRNEFRKTVQALDERLTNILYDLRKKYEDVWRARGEVVKCDILIGGMGGRIFTVRENIEKVFNQFKVVNIYGDKSVAEGLAIYAGKLEGYSYAEDIILLDVLFCTLSLKGEVIIINQEEYDEHVKEVILFQGDTTIPTEKIVQIRLEGKKRLKVELTCGHRRDTVKWFDIGDSVKSTKYEIIASVDANSQIEIQVLEMEEGIKYKFVVERFLIRE